MRSGIYNISEINISLFFFSNLIWKIFEGREIIKLWYFPAGVGIRKGYI